MSPPPRRPEPPESVNPGVDTILRLVPFSDIDQQDTHYHRICCLQIGERCEILESVGSWEKSSRTEFQRIHRGLTKVAENQEIPSFKNIKRVGRSRQVIQIAGDNARLYCFEDTDAQCTVVCVTTFWIGKGAKKTMQNRAIEEAERLMARWKTAVRIEGDPDLRIERH